MKGVKAMSRTAKYDIDGNEIYNSAWPDELDNDQGMKPCPFCGNQMVELKTGNEENYPDYKNDFAVVCPTYNKGCGAASGFKATPYKAIEAWNTRVQDPVKTYTRKSILTTAEETVCTDRESMYGKPEDNFKLISELWGAYLFTSLTQKDVAVMMMLLKIARIATGDPHSDYWIDIAGYAACGGEAEGKEAEK